MGAGMVRRRVEMPEHLRDRARIFAEAWVSAARETAAETVAVVVAFQEAGGRLPVEVE